MKNFMNDTMKINLFMLAVFTYHLSFGMMVGRKPQPIYRSRFQDPAKQAKWNEARKRAVEGLRQDLIKLREEDKLFEETFHIAGAFAEYTPQQRCCVDRKQEERSKILLSLPSIVAQQRIREEFRVMGQRLDEDEKKEHRKCIGEDIQRSFFDDFEVYKKRNFEQMGKKGCGVIGDDLCVVWVNAVQEAMQLDGLEVSSVELSCQSLKASALAASTIVGATELLKLHTGETQASLPDVVSDIGGYEQYYVRGDYRREIILSAGTNLYYKSIDDNDKQKKLSKEMNLRHTAFHEVAHLVKGHSFMYLENYHVGAYCAKERSADVYHALKSPQAAQCGRWVENNNEGGCRLSDGSYPYMAVADTNWKTLEEISQSSRKKSDQ